MPNSRYIDTVDAAKMLRALLKKNFPGAVFSVRSSRYAGGSSIHISWQNGPSEKKVRELTQPYAGASFDGMIDMQTYNTAIMLADGTVTYGIIHNGPGVRGVNHPLPEGAEYVHFGCDYVQTAREETLEGIMPLIEKWNKENGAQITVDNSIRWPRLRCDDYTAFGRFHSMLRETDL